MPLHPKEADRCLQRVLVAEASGCLSEDQQGQCVDGADGPCQRCHALDRPARCARNRNLDPATPLHASSGAGIHTSRGECYNHIAEPVCHNIVTEIER